MAGDPPLFSTMVGPKARIDRQHRVVCLPNANPLFWREI
jgi:hypothetical protein